MINYSIWNSDWSKLSNMAYLLSEEGRMHRILSVESGIINFGKHWTGIGWFVKRQF